MHDVKLRSIGVANEYAVQALSRGEYETATKIFRFALTRVIAHYALKAKNGSGHECSCCELENLKILRIHRVSVIEDESRFAEKEALSCSIGHAPLQFYNRAIILDGNDEVMTSSRRALNRTKMVLLLNIALAQYLKGSSTSEDSMKILRVYQLASEIYANRDKADSSPWWHLECDSLLMLAIFNNMGFIYSQFSHQIQVDHCLSCMEWLLSAVISMKEDGTNLREDFPFFVVNSVILKGTFSAPAA